jgi:DNA-binding NtrC family response regulator
LDISLSEQEIKSTVMIIDDEANLLTESKNALENQGIKVHAFIDPMTALDHIQNEDCKTCSIIISDIRMPVMTGFELVRQLKKVRPEMKIILMTEFEMNKKEFEKVFPSVKVDDLIKKPFKIVDLIYKIKYQHGRIPRSA